MKLLALNKSRRRSGDSYWNEIQNPANLAGHTHHFDHPRARNDMKTQTSKPKGTERNDGLREFHMVSQLAKLLKLTEAAIYWMARRGALPRHTIGRNQRFRPLGNDPGLGTCS